MNEKSNSLSIDNMSEKNICFYSNQCKMSEAFLTELSQTPLKQQFQYICVDPSPSRPKLPGFLKKVPTIIVKGEQEPLVANDAINWLWITKMQHENTKKETQTSSPDENMGLGYWNPLEMNATGDPYSFIDSDTSTSQTGDMRIAQNYEFIGGAGLSGAGAGPGAGPGTDQGTGRSGGGHPKVSAKQQAFESEMERYKQMRDMGMPQPVKRM